MVQSSDVHSFQLRAARDGYEYFSRMRAKGRALTVRDLNGPVAVVSFFLTNDPKDIRRFYKKELWEVVEDDPEGVIVYIDKLLSNKWNLTIRKMIAEVISMHYPKWRIGVWMRPTAGKDRVYTYRRKGE